MHCPHRTCVKKIMSTLHIFRKKLYINCYITSDITCMIATYAAIRYRRLIPILQTRKDL